MTLNLVFCHLTDWTITFGDMGGMQTCLPGKGRIITAFFPSNIGGACEIFIYEKRGYKVGTRFFLLNIGGGGEGTKPSQYFSL